MATVAELQTSTYIHVMRQSGTDDRYDGLEVYLPDVGRLLAGDILLTFNSRATIHKERRISHTIRAVTKGRFSHALICAAPPTFVEAIGTGVGTLSLALCFAHDIEDVRVLRHPDGDVAQRAGSMCLMEVGRDYSLPRAVGAVLPEAVIRRIKDQGTFCSALVAQAFTTAGADIFAATPVHRTTPATIERMTGLLDVTADVFRRALAPRNIELMSALDGDRVPSPAGGQVDLSKRFAMAVMPLAEELIRANPDAGLKLEPTLNGMLQLVMDGFEAACHGAVPQQLVKHLDAEIAALFARGEHEALMDEVERRDLVAMARDLEQSHLPFPDLDRKGVEELLGASRLQLRMRKDALRGLAQWERRSNAMQAKLRLDRRAAEHIARRIPRLEEILANLDR